MLTAVLFLAAHSLIQTLNAGIQLMKKSESSCAIPQSTLEQASKLFAAHQQTIYKSTDRMFAVLMSIQQIAGLIAALWIAPRTFIVTTNQTHLDERPAIFIGG